VKNAYRLLPLLFALVLACAAVARPSAGGDDAGVRAVALVGLSVSDLERSRAFFEGVLDFRFEDESEVTGEDVERLHGVFGVRARIARLRLGDERIELTQYLAPEGRPLPADARSNDLSFQHVAIVVSDMQRAYARLREHRVRHASSGPQLLPDWNPNAGGIEAFYFKDPDGHALEVIAYPPGKGDPRWQQGGERLFLGLDHTAIAVSDTERSLAFYRDVLGLSVAGASENWGTEQEHLNNVFGARLRITALRAASGPGVELLEYLAPRDGRPYPPDARACDLVHWHVRMVAGELGSVERAVRDAHAALVSPGVVELAGGELGFASGLRLRDPDGHVIEVVQERGQRPAEERQ
jgi:catechol 2,3-dioxygenase-like lactoylglutathione lyase family enzyme